MLNTARAHALAMLLQLPPELLVHLLRSLDVKWLLACRRVCRQLRVHASDDALWRELAGKSHKCGIAVPEELTAFAQTVASCRICEHCVGIRRAQLPRRYIVQASELEQRRRQFERDWKWPCSEEPPRPTEGCCVVILWSTLHGPHWYMRRRDEDPRDYVKSVLEGGEDYHREINKVTEYFAPCKDSGWENDAFQCTHALVTGSPAAMGEWEAVEHTSTRESWFGLSLSPTHWRQLEQFLVGLMPDEGAPSGFGNYSNRLQYDVAVTYRALDSLLHSGDIAFIFDSRRLGGAYAGLCADLSARESHGVVATQAITVVHLPSRKVMRFGRVCGLLQYSGV